MRRKCKAALAAAAAALALCALPFAAQAGSWGGTVLSKGLVYEDVYGVVNGNAQMAKTVRKSENATVYELDLVASDGTVLFKTGYQADQYGDVTASKDFRYKPFEPLSDCRASITGEFGRSHGGMRAIDTTNDKVVVANAKGEKVLEDCDGAAILYNDELAIGAWACQGGIELKLVDLNSGDVLHTLQGFEGATAVEGVYNSESGSQVDIDTNLNKHTYITVAGNRMELHAEDFPGIDFDNELVYKDQFYTVRQQRSGNYITKVMITQPTGDEKVINGSFRSIYVQTNDGEFPLIWAADGTGAYRYFSLDGTEQFSGKGYASVTRLAYTDASLCWADRNGTRTFYIDRPDGQAKLLETVKDYNITYSALNQFIIKKTSVSIGDYSLAMVTAILDSSGRTLQTFDPNDHWLIESAKTWTDQGPAYLLEDAELRLYQFPGLGLFNGPSRYLDSKLNVVKELNGRLDLDSPYLVKGNTTFPLLTNEHSTKHHLPKTLYNAKLEVVRAGKYEYAVAGNAYLHGQLIFVGDGEGNYGAIDSKTQAPTIPVIFDSIYDMGTQDSGDTVLVHKDNMWYFMDTSGKTPDKPSPETPSFSDVDASTPHKDHIAWLAAKGISKGWDNGDGTFDFRPFETVKRCDMAAFLYRLAGEPDFDEGSAPTFSDVDQNTPHRRAILWLAYKGISKGWDNGDGTYSFRPYEVVKRCDMAAFLYRLAGGPELDEAAAASFADVVADTPHRKAVLWLAASGVSTGWVEEDGSRTFRPYHEVARCDMAAFLHRMDENGLVK